MNCLEGFDLDSVNTKYLVIIKFTTTPIKKEIANEIVELRTVKENTW
jgi:hypothetical protein